MTKKNSHPHVVFWTIVLGPWLLDLAAGRGVQSTAFGGVLWGIATVTSVVYPRTRDPQLRSWLGRTLLVLSSAWLTYWVLAFAESPRQMSLSPEWAQGLAWIHGGLLLAGASMVLILWFGSGLWILQEKSLRRSSWERRRTHPASRLPSLESLASIADGSLKLAFACWGFGLLIALITGMIRWQSQHPSDLTPRIDLTWWLDSKVLATMALWLLLALAFQLRISSEGREPRSLFRAYSLISTLFIFTFSWYMMGGRSAIHGPLSWFLK